MNRTEISVVVIETPVLERIGQSSYSYKQPDQNVYMHLRIFKEMYQERLRSFLQRQDGRTLPAKTRAVFAVLIGCDKVIGDLSNKACEWQLANQKVRRLLVFADFSQRYRTWLEALSLFNMAYLR